MQPDVFVFTDFSVHTAEPERCSRYRSSKTTEREVDALETSSSPAAFGLEYLPGGELLQDVADSRLPSGTKAQSGSQSVALAWSLAVCRGIKQRL